jgi:hypothetical protein
VTSFLIHCSLAFIFIAALLSLISPLSFGLPAELPATVSIKKESDDSEEQPLLQPPMNDFHSAPLLSFTSSDDRQTM